MSTPVLLPPATIAVVINGQGSSGTSGSSGTTGSSGAAATYIFTQLAPITVWAIQHNLGRFPDVTVIDAHGAEVEGDVAYVDSNNLTITFSIPFAGTAYLN